MLARAASRLVRTVAARNVRPVVMTLAPLAAHARLFSSHPNAEEEESPVLSLPEVLSNEIQVRLLVFHCANLFVFIVSMCRRSWPMMVRLTKSFWT